MEMHISDFTVTSEFAQNSATAKQWPAKNSCTKYMRSNNFMSSHATSIFGAQHTWQISLLPLELINNQEGLATHFDKRIECRRDLAHVVEAVGGIEITPLDPCSFWGCRPINLRSRHHTCKLQRKCKAYKISLIKCATPTQNEVNAKIAKSLPPPKKKKTWY